MLWLTLAVYAALLPSAVAHLAYLLFIWEKQFYAPLLIVSLPVRDGRYLRVLLYGPATSSTSIITSMVLQCAITSVEMLPVGHAAFLHQRHRYNILAAFTSTSRYTPQVLGYLLFLCILRLGRQTFDSSLFACASIQGGALRTSTNTQRYRHAIDKHYLTILNQSLNDNSPATMSSTPAGYE